MKSKQKKQNVMESMSVPKALLKLGLPTMVGMMISAFYNLVDTFFVGTLGTSQTAAVSAAFPLSIIFLAIGLLFGSGASSCLARLLGEKRYDKSNQYFVTSLITAVICAVIANVLILIFLSPVLTMLGATETMMPYAKEYAVPFLIGLIINVFNITVNNMISAEGATSMSMFAMLAGGLANMILDPVLIVFLGMGVRGAAIATLLSRCISASIYLYYLFFGKSSFKLSLHSFQPQREIYQKVFTIGLPMLFYELLCCVAMSTTNFMSKEYGDAVVAGIGVSNRIISLGSMMVIGFLKGYQPFVGFNYGAKQYERARTATKIMLKWSTGFCIIVGLVNIIFHSQMIQIFTKVQDPLMIEIGGKNLLLNSITFMALGFSMVYDFLFLAIGNAKEAGMISVTRQGIFFLPIILILPHFIGINGILFAQPIADILTGLMIVKMIYHKKFIPVIA